MNPHVRIGDPPGTLSSGGTSSFTTCNCACSRCLSGSCCQWPADPPTPAWGRTWTETRAVPEWAVCDAIGHDFAVFDPARLFCRKCGTTRNV